MYCKYCGNPIPDGELNCPACGQSSGTETCAQQQSYSESASEPKAQQPVYSEPAADRQPSNPPAPINSTAYLIWAILVTVMCCLPLGIPAIIYATKIDKEWALGNYDIAYDCAKKAKNFAIGGAIASLVGIVLYFVLVIVLMLAGIAGY